MRSRALHAGETARRQRRVPIARGRTREPAHTTRHRRGSSRWRATARTVTHRISNPTMPAHRRWRCSSHILRSQGGIHCPEQAGQSGHARPESVARTAPPIEMSRSVAPAVVTALLGLGCVAEPAGTSDPSDDADITVIADDMLYDPDGIEVPAGEAVSLCLASDGPSSTTWSSRTAGSRARSGQARARCSNCRC